MDCKAEVMLGHYRALIENEAFDEYTIYGFLIFIRSYLHDEKDTLKAVYEFCDLVAHRERDQGRAYNSIKGAKKNRYSTLPGTKHIDGYNGIFYEEWVSDLTTIAEKFQIRMTERISRDIVLCIVALAQYCEFGDGAKFELFQSPDGYIDLTTTEGKSDSYYICFCKVGPYEFAQEYEAGYISEPVEALRIDGRLRLKAKDHFVI